MEGGHGWERLQWWIAGREGGTEERAGPETGRRGWGLYGKLEQSVSIIQAWAVAEWEVVMDQSGLPLSRKRAQRGQAQTGGR